MVDAQERSPMIPPPKIKCKKQQYNKDGTCAYLGWKIKEKCLKQNCIYYEGAPWQWLDRTWILWFLYVWLQDLSWELLWWFLYPYYLAPHNHIAECVFAHDHPCRHPWVHLHLAGTLDTLLSTEALKWPRPHNEIGLWSGFWSGFYHDWQARRTPAGGQVNHADL